MLATEERCLEWHAWYEDQEGELWQLDMIHIEKGSRYDGYFEEVARRISAALTDETREAILRLKWETLDTEKSQASNTTWPSCGTASAATPISFAGAKHIP